MSFHGLRTSRNACRSVVCTMAAVLTLSTLSQVAFARGRLIPAASRIDVMYDNARHIAYITNGGQVLRYDTVTNQLLNPFELGGNLMCMDISPDGNTLAVADSKYDSTAGTSWFYLVNLETGNSRKVTFAREGSEYGTYSLAYGSDGKLLFTVRFSGSGWTPLRIYDPATGAITKALSEDLTQDVMLCASGDRSVIGWAESNISDGRFGRYRVSDGNIIHNTWYERGTSWFNYEIGVSRDGSQYALPTYGGTFIYDSSLTKTGTVGVYASGQPISAHYHPTKDIVYFAWSTTTKVRAYDTKTLTQVDDYDFENTFDHPGNHALVEGRLEVSGDGNLLFATVAGGVRMVNIGNKPPSTVSVSVTTPEDTAADVTPAASDPEGNPVTFVIASNPAHGTAKVVGNKMVYTPSANYFGSDSFTYKATDGDAESAVATATISVTPVNDPPVANWLSVTTVEDKPISITVTGSDVDSTSLSFNLVSQPKHGTLTGIVNGVYTPEYDFNGTDSFQFTVSDGSLTSAPATVTITVTPGVEPVATTIGKAKKMASGTYVLLQGVVVTAINIESGVSFIASPDRIAGIKMLTNLPLKVGQRLTKVKGYAERVNGEWQLRDCSVLSAIDGLPLTPLLMTTKSVANDRSENLSHQGIDTAGMLVRLSGVVTAVLPSQRIVYVDDGFWCSDGLGPWYGLRIKLPANAALPAPGSRITFNGISRVEKYALTQWGDVNAEWYPAGWIVYVPSVWIRSATEIEVVQ